MSANEHQPTFQKHNLIVLRSDAEPICLIWKNLRVSAISSGCTKTAGSKSRRATVIPQGRHGDPGDSPICTKKDFGQSPLRSCVKNPSRAQILCWDQVFNPQNTLSIQSG
jgi:hypothetical protein